MAIFSNHGKKGSEVIKHLPHARSLLRALSSLDHNLQNYSILHGGSQIPMPGVTTARILMAN